MFGSGGSILIYPTRALEGSEVKTHKGVCEIKYQKVFSDALLSVPPSIPAGIYLYYSDKWLLLSAGSSPLLMLSHY